ncbi:MAG TPA: DUF3237 domain-containing protein [Terriglobia bacterium]|jgi:hypothetical protein
MKPSPQLTLIMEVRAQVAAPIEISDTGGYRRRIVPIVGGTFEGRGELTVKGRVVPGGADSQMIQPDGLTIADARYLLETEHNQVIYVRNRGVRYAPLEVMRKLLANEPVDPALVYFRTTPVFETGAPELQVLMRSVFAGSGERYPAEVRLDFWKVE